MDDVTRVLFFKFYKDWKDRLHRQLQEKKGGEGVIKLERDA